VVSESSESRIVSRRAFGDRITVAPERCHGKPCIRDLRYPVAFLLELLSAGMSVEEVLHDYPDLERDDILAAFAFAAELSRSKRLELP
jgi:uncharacterized protein (DUF433 family)